MKSPKCEALEVKCQGTTKPDGAGSGASDDKLGAEALARVEGFRTQMCACKDKACADGVNDAMTKWGMQMSKQNPDAKTSPELTKKMTDLMVEYSTCMTKLFSDATPPG